MSDTRPFDYINKIETLNLDPYEYRTLMKIFLLTGGGPGECFASLQHLSEATKICRRKLIYIIQKLKNLNIINALRRHHKPLLITLNQALDQWGVKCMPCTSKVHDVHPTKITLSRRTLKGPPLIKPLPNNSALARGEKEGDGDGCPVGAPPPIGNVYRFKPRSEIQNNETNTDKDGYKKIEPRSYNDAYKRNGEAALNLIEVVKKNGSEEELLPLAKLIVNSYKMSWEKFKTKYQKLILEGKVNVRIFAARCKFINHEKPPIQLPAEPTLLDKMQKDYEKYLIEWGNNHENALLVLESKYRKEDLEVFCAKFG